MMSCRRPESGNNYQIDSDDFYNDIGHDFAFIGFDTDNYGTVYAHQLVH